MTTEPPGPASDGLGLRKAMPERMLPCLVAAMAFLAAIALAGAVGAHLLARRWSIGAGAMLTVQVPDPDAASAHGPRTTRIEAVQALLARTPELAAMRRLDEAELRRLLHPWLGDASDLPLPLPTVVQLRLRAAAAPPALAQTLAGVAPGTQVEDSAVWNRRLLAFAASLQACAGMSLLIVAVVAGCVVALATRAGIATRRHAIEIIHGLGASDGYIAGRFAERAGALALIGGAIGAALALPLLGSLSHLAGPFVSAHVALSGPPDAWPGAVLASMLPDALPWPLLAALPALPLAAGLIGWLTAQGTVRVWLRRLP